MSKRDASPRSASVSPGPGSYPKSDPFGLGKTGPSFSTGRAPQRASFSPPRGRNDPPPPLASASPEQFAKLQSRTPVYSMGKSSRFAKPREVAPPVGKYEPRPPAPGPAARIGSEPHRLRPDTEPKKVPYFGEEFASVNRGLHSPGPGAYAGPKAAPGDGAPRFSFGTAPQRVFPPPSSPNAGLLTSRSAPTGPGPGSYAVRPTMGKERDKSLLGSGGYGFGTSPQRVRPQAEPRKAVYMGREFESESLGAWSPGPTAYRPPPSPSHSPRFSFDRARRFS
eukprot:tig00020629_g12394.t1